MGASGVDCGVAIARAGGDVAAVACGVAVALRVGETVALGEGEGVCVGGALGDGDAGAVGEGEGVRCAFFFAVDFFRCGRGVGEGPVKSLLIFAPNESWASWVARAWLATAIATVIAITSTARNFILTDVSPGDQPTSSSNTT